MYSLIELSLITYFPDDVQVIYTNKDQSTVELHVGPNFNNSISMDLSLNYTVKGKL
jgi:hypothetical protein